MYSTLSHRYTHKLPLCHHPVRIPVAGRLRTHTLCTRAIAHHLRSSLHVPLRRLSLSLSFFLYILVVLLVCVVQQIKARERKTQVKERNSQTLCQKFFSKSSRSNLKNPSFCFFPLSPFSSLFVFYH